MPVISCVKYSGSGIVMQSAGRKPAVAKSVIQAEQAAKPSLITVQRGTVIGRGHIGVLASDYADVNLAEVRNEPIQDRPQTRLKTLIPQKR